MEKERFSVEEKKEIVAYGIARGKNIFIGLSVTLLLGLSLGIFYQSIEFLIVFYALRRYAGGYHADSIRRCYFISFLAVLFSLCCIKYVECSLIFCFFLQTICLLILLVVSPVETENRKLEDFERIKYKRKTRVNAIVLYILNGVFYCIGNFNAVFPIVIAYFLATVLLIAGSIKNCCQSGQSFSVL